MNAFVVAAAFGGTFPDEPIKLYPRMTQVCMEKMDLCDPEDSPRYAQLNIHERLSAQSAGGQADLAPPRLQV